MSKHSEPSGRIEPGARRAADWPSDGDALPVTELPFHDLQAPSEVGDYLPDLIVGRLGRSRSHEGTLTAPTHDQSVVLEQAQCPLDRAERDTELRNELIMLGELVPRAEVAPFDPGTNCLRQLDVRRPPVVRVEFVHPGESTEAELAKLEHASLARLATSAIIADSAAVAATAVSADKKAPACAATPAGARTETLGETMQFERTRMYRVREVADHFGVHPATIYRAIEAGELFALRLGHGGGAIRVPGDAVGTYAQLCAEAANPGGIHRDAEAPASVTAGGAR